MKIEKILRKHADKTYASFQAKLTPTIDAELFIGVRVPEARQIAKVYIKDPEYLIFIKKLPHHYYDENMLHGLLISEMKDYDECIKEVNRFLPYVDNWAVCDIMSPKIFRKHKDKLINEIKKWIKSKKTYTIRFGIEMLMSHYFDDDFKTEYLKLACSNKSDEYYVKMMVAWFFATALAKQYELTLPYLKKRILPTWTHNKTIQKACESYRITNEQKAYLRTLKYKE
ncbi:MAG: DNA alkylation repair protein [Bacilli bacterium]|nr:DNA alkylation repair protein [Bacilli bacterium]